MNKSMLIIICGVVLLLFFILTYNDGSFSVSGVVIKTESFWGGCQHTDFCNVYFEDGNTQWFNPSLDFVEALPLNRTYTFHLRYDNNSDGTVIWCNQIDDANGLKIYER